MSNQSVIQNEGGDIAFKFGVFLFALFIISLAGALYYFLPELSKKILQELLRNMHLATGVTWQ